jgi:hypothetical protein
VLADLPIPEFDGLDPRHARLAELSRAAHRKVADSPPDGQWKKQLLAAEAEVAEADGLVRQVCAAPRRG